MRIVEYLPADVQNHGAVALDQDGEGRFRQIVTSGQEPLQKLPVRQSLDDPQTEQRPDVSQ
jgi:hypothetical protein